MRFYVLASPIPLFDLRRDHSSVPTKFRKAAAHSGGQGRPTIRRECPLSLTAARIATFRRSVWTMLSIVAAIVTATSVVVRDANCEPLSVTQKSSSVGDQVDGLISQASERFGIPAAWLHAIMRLEGGGDVRVASRKGAIGLMQVTPETWMELRLRYALGADPSDPRDNIPAGAAHLREMYDRYGSNGFLAAYDMGPSRYDEHLKTSSPLPLETQAYVAVLAPLVEPGLKEVAGSTTRAKVTSWHKAPLFVAQPKRGSSNNSWASSAPAEHSPPSQSDADQPAFAPHSSGLFVRRGMAERAQ